MSINNLNTYLNVRDAHLRVVSGNVYAQAMNIGGINVETAHGLQSVSDTGNVTSNTLQFSNATTGFVTTANAQIGRDLVVTGNATVSEELTVASNAIVSSNLNVSDDLIVTNNILASNNITVTGNLNVTTIRSDSNVVTEYTGPHDRPLRKYPDVTFPTQTNGDIGDTTVTYKGYTLTSSTTYPYTNHNLTNVFDGLTGDDVSTGWSSNYGNYTLATGAAISTNRNGLGDYIQLELPNAIKIQHIKIFSQGTSGWSNGPRDITLYGSNSGNEADWTSIKVATELPLNGHALNATVHVNSMTFYRYFRLEVNKIWVDSSPSSDPYGRIAEWELYGHEEGSGSLDTTLKTVFNVPATTGTQLEVYYDAKGESTVQSPIPDLSPNTNTGAVSGHSPTLDSTDGIDSFKFNGSSQYVTGAHGLTTGGGPVHTISLWLNATEMTNYTYVVQLGQGGTSHQQSAIMFYENKISHAHWGSGVLSDVTLTKNVWYHVVAVFTGGNGSDLSKHKIFINGEDGRVGPFPGSTDGAVVLTGTQVTLGRNNNHGGSPGNYFNGSIANFRVYSKALSIDQVKELYDYQKDYFLGSKSQVTLYKGHLGVGVTEPSGQLELAGDERVQEYPPRGMTDEFRVGISNHIEGHGVFKATSSSIYLDSTSNYQTWMAFNKKNESPWSENTWNGGDNVYSDSTGLYTGNQEIAGIKGDWIKLQFPYQIKLHGYTIGVRGAWYKHAPDDWILLGSNDDNNWEVVDSMVSTASGTSLRTSRIPESSGDTVVYRNLTVNSTKYYRYFALVTTKLRLGPNPANTDNINISDLRYYGTPGPTTLDKGSLTLGRSLDVPRISRYDVDTETPRPEKLLIDYDTTVNSSLTDISGKGNHGTFFDDAHWSAADKAFKFDGTDDYTATNIAITGGNMAWTQSMWFKINAFPATSTNYAILSFFGDKSSLSGHLMSYRPGEFWQDWYGNGVKASYTLEVGKWYHVVSVYHGNTSTDANVRSSIYINGVKQTLVWYSQTSSQMTLPTSTSYELADYINSSNVRHNGWISNPKLYNVALEPSEARKLYNLGRTGRSMVISDTAVGIGRAPEAQLDVRGIGKFETCHIRAGEISGTHGMLDINQGVRTTNGQLPPSHTPPLYVTGNFGSNNNGVEFRHSNQSQGIGFGFNTIYATGYASAHVSGQGNQDLNLKSLGTGSVRSNGSVVQTSDDRIKTNEKYITNATETLLKLKPQVYDKHQKINEICENPIREAGLITQDVYYDAPELRLLVQARNEGLDATIPVNIPEEKPFVDDDPSKDPDYSGWGTDVASLNYIGFIPYLIKSNQELYAEIQTLEHKDHTQELRAENNRLKNKVVILENRQTHFNTLLVDVIGRIEKLERPT